MKSVSKGGHYYTNYLFQPIEIVVIRIISDSSDRPGAENNACEVVIVGTQHRLLRRISDLWEVF